MTNIHSREDFRQKSLIAGVCKGQISGFGVDSYKLAMQALCTMLKKQSLVGLIFKLVYKSVHKSGSFFIAMLRFCGIQKKH